MVPPAAAAEFLDLWTVTVTPTLRKWCGDRVPRHFAVVQDAHVNAVETDVVRDAHGDVISYGLRPEVTPVVTACSEGGTPLEARSVVGWSTTDGNLAPLARKDVIRTVHEGVGGLTDAVVQKALPTVTRSVVDFGQRVKVDGPNLDVYGACSFPDGTEAKSLVYWDTPDTYSEWFLEVIDGHVEVNFWAVAPGGVRIR